MLESEKIKDQNYIIQLQNEVIKKKEVQINSIQFAAYQIRRA